MQAQTHLTLFQIKTWKICFYLSIGNFVCLLYNQNHDPSFILKPGHVWELGARETCCGQAGLNTANTPPELSITPETETWRKHIPRPGLASSRRDKLINYRVYITWCLVLHFHTSLARQLSCREINVAKNEENYSSLCHLIEQIDIVTFFMMCYKKEPDFWAEFHNPVKTILYSIDFVPLGNKFIFIKFVSCWAVKKSWPTNLGLSQWNKILIGNLQKCIKVRIGMKLLCSMCFVLEYTPWNRELTCC